MPDSITIPIFGTLVASAFVSPFLGWVALRSSTPSRPRSVPASVLTAAASLAAYVASGLFGLAGMAYWAEPHHYPIVASYLVILLLVGTLLAIDVVQALRRRARGFG
jgi:hypothetical protein